MELSKFNPGVILLYFMSNILITMLTKNPVFIMISFGSVVIYSLLVKFPNKLLKYIIMILIVLLMSTFLNPLFNSQGDTVLYTIGKTNFTLEAHGYGFIAALMIISVVLWFRNYNLLMSSDKFLYLFSGSFPNLSLIISMVLKLIPEMIKKIKDLDDAQKVIGIYAKEGFFKKLKNKFLILGSLFTYTIEHSLQSAISMKARGYGLKGKTRFTKYKFKFRDLLLSISILAFSIFIIIGSSNILFDYAYYPNITPIATDNISLISYLLFFLLANYASILHIKEKIKWHYLKLKIYPSPTL